MKKYFDPVSLTITGLVVVLLTGAFLVIPLGITSLGNSSKTAQLQCEELSNIISLKINASADVIRNYSYLIANLAETDLIPKEKKREFMLLEMKLRHKNEKALKNIWCNFEPNALDGMDKQFVNQAGSDSLGRFAPWFLENDLIESTSKHDYMENHHKLPKETRHEVVSEPYWDKIQGEDRLMISFSMPVMLNDKFLGVVGTDLYIEELNELVESKNLIGSNKLVTDKGVIVLHDDNHDLIGKQNDNFIYDEIISKLSGKNLFNFINKSSGSRVYTVYAPVSLGDENKPWVYLVEVPAKHIYLEAMKSIGFKGIILVLFIVIAYLYVTIRKNHQLTELHKLKDKLFSVIAHDLRGPVGSLLSLLKIRNVYNLDSETHKKLFETISNRVTDMYDLLDNLLRWAKSQMQGVSISPIYFDAQTEILEVLQTMQDYAAHKLLLINNNTFSQQIFADKDMFAVVFRNLITNAIKFTPENGEITVGTELASNMLIISVQDTGTGMSKNIQEKLFNITKTESKPGTNNEMGTGLGLVLCADFVKSNKGNIWFDSEIGRGSTFYFSMPIKG